MDDGVFDLVYAPEFQKLSRQYWTPLAVTRVAGTWLREFRASRVLDVGSGVGKFCLVLAGEGSLKVCGLEHRQALVEAALGAAAALRVGPVEFIHDAVHDFDPTGFDAFYAFNPFDENFYSCENQIDSSVELCEERFWRDISIFESWLARAPLRTALVTYHELGGRIPGCYAMVRRAFVESGWLRLWVKVRPSCESHDFHVEFSDRELHSQHLKSLVTQRARAESPNGRRVLRLLKLEDQEAPAEKA